MVYETASAAVGRARSGQGPILLELKTYRITGHSRRDPCLYQPKEERERALENEPIGRYGTYLLGADVADQEALDEIASSVDEEVEGAVAVAMAAPEPRPEDTLADLFVDA